MNVILLEKVENLGNLGDRVKVKPGFARNYLIPQGKAVPATPANVAHVEARRAELEKASQEKLVVAMARGEALTGLGVTITARTGEEGRLFGSIGAADIAQAVTQAGAPLDKHEVRLPDGPLRQVGEYQVCVHLHSDVDSSVRVVIVAAA
jgi:ribosomal protein L9